MKKSSAILILIILTAIFIKSFTTVITSRKTTKNSEILKLKTTDLIEPVKKNESQVFPERTVRYDGNQEYENDYPQIEHNEDNIRNNYPKNTEHHPKKHIEFDNHKHLTENPENYGHIHPQENHTSPFEKSLKICKPYKEELKTEFMGINMAYSINIEGWINNKCILNFYANAESTGESFQNTYGIAPDDAIIKTFSPNIHCEFTKEQLDYAGDNILEEKSRNHKNMLKNPNEIDFSGSNISDLKLIDILVNQKPCKILNTNELEKFFN